MKKKMASSKLTLDKKVIGKLDAPSKVTGGRRQIEAGVGGDTNKPTGCGMTCWSYGDYCFLSENCA